MRAPQRGVCVDPILIARGREVDPPRSSEAAAEEATRWKDLGTTYATSNGNAIGMKRVDLHIDAI